MNLTEQFKSFTLLGAEWVLWLLVILSVVSIGVMIERWRFFSMRKVDLERLTAAVRTAIRAGENKLDKPTFGSTDSMPVQVAQSGLREQHNGIDAAAEAMTSTKAVARQQHEQFLAVLGTLGNNAPFIGLFGTVLGIIIAFNELGKNLTGGADKIMSGISEALVATAVGLLVALPAVIAFNYFNRKVRQAVTSSDVIAHLLLGELHAKQIDKDDKAA